MRCQGQVFDKATKEWKRCSMNATREYPDGTRFCKFHDPYEVYERRVKRARAYDMARAKQDAAAQAEFERKMRGHPWFRELRKLVESAQVHGVFPEWEERARKILLETGGNL